MATRSKSLCRHAGCGLSIAMPGYCDKHKTARNKEDNERRGTAHERGYTSAWARARAHYLRAHPLCVYCARQGRPTAASVVDHIKPHRLKQAIDSGDEQAIKVAKELFWDSENNWQSLCAPHHDITKQREEAAERSRR